MPELPEVETIRRGLIPHLQDEIIQEVIVRFPTLRWPIPNDLNSCLDQQKIERLSRRGKYLLLHMTKGTLIIHLGMSGSLRMIDAGTLPSRHDHVDIVLTNQKIMRYRDPRRFGAILWTTENPLNHPLLKSIGIEPFDENFTGLYLYQRALKRKMPVKAFIMDSKIVAGVGNIYAAESLFIARIHPLLPAGQLTKEQCTQLVEAIRHILELAIAAGGTTLKDFINSDGKPGYFLQKLYVYGRNQQPCRVCNTLLQSQQLGKRSTVFCEVCQAKNCE